MNEILSIFILLAEILMVLQCLQIAFRKNLQFDKYMLGIVLIDLVVYLGINIKVIPRICSVLLYVLIFIYCYHVFKETVIKTVIGVIIGCSLAACIEVVTACVANLFKNQCDLIFILLFSSFLSLIFAYGIKRCIPLLANNWSLKLRSRRGMFGLILFYGLALGILLIDYYWTKGLIKIYAVFILTFMLFIFFYLYRLDQAQNEIDRKNYELELQNIYGGTYNELLSEVRRKQHDFKNQLNAIYSMHLVAQSLEELVDMQTEYGQFLQVDNKYDSILTCCDNTILSGYIYYKCNSCEKEGITIAYDIHMQQVTCAFAIHEIIEILGILIDNACESVEANPAVDMCIRLRLQEDEEKIVMAVSNPAKYVTFSEIEKMFTHGYSSKGENRGLGLARVQELVKRHSAEIKVSNVMHNEKNWISFAIEIVK